MHCYIGLNEQGEPRIYASWAELSPVVFRELDPLSSIHRRGKPFPKVVVDVQEGNGKGQEFEALALLREYYFPTKKTKIEHSGRLEFGQKLP